MSTQGFTASVIGLLVGVAATPAQAQTVIDFDGFVGVVTNQFPEATFSSDAGFENTAFASSSAQSAPNILCTGPAGGVVDCIQPTYIDFTDPVDNLTFWAIEANAAGVTAQFNVFQNGTFSTTVDLVSPGGGTGTHVFVDLSAFSNVTRLEIVNILDDPSENGIGWDTFRFDVVAECFLVLGEGPGSETWSFKPGDHPFVTQLGGVGSSWPVQLDDVPELVVHDPATTGIDAQLPFDPNGTLTLRRLRYFTAQVLMWNPEQFPANPEQSTHALAVVVAPGGAVYSTPFGTSDGGMLLWTETYWNAQGQKVLRLPFSIPGF